MNRPLVVLALTALCACGKSSSSSTATAASTGTHGAGTGTNTGTGTGTGTGTNTGTGTGTNTGASGSTGHTGGTTGLTAGNSGSTGLTTGNSGSTGSPGTTSAGNSGGSSGGTSATTGACDPLTLTGVAPANDACGTAQVIDPATQLGVDITGTTDNAQNDFAYDGSSSCTGYQTAGGDVVYSFTPTATGIYAFILSPTTSWDPAVYVMASCASTCAATAACVAGTDQGVEGDPEAFSANLTAGTTYFVVVDNYDGSESGPFTLNVSSVPAPTNDSCAAPKTLPEGATGLAAETFGGAADDYSPSATATQCTGQTEDGADVVYSFTPAATGSYMVHLQGTGPSASVGLGFYVLDTCPAAGAAITSCLGGVGTDTNDPVFTLVNLTGGQTYTIVVEAPAFADPSSISFALAAYPFSPPSNDSCAAPKVLPEGPTGLASESFVGAADDYAPATGAVGCTGFGAPGPDLVYSFTPSQSGAYAFDAVPDGGTTDLSLYLVDTCPSSASVSACVAGADHNGINASEHMIAVLNGGTTYFLIADNYRADADGTFSITAQPAVFPAGENCEALTTDGGTDVVLLPFGDGGLGATLGVSTVGTINDSESANAGTCNGGGFGGDRVYHLALAQPAPSVSARVETDGGFGAVLYLRSGPCVDGPNVPVDGGASGELACSQSDAGFTTGALPAGDYYLWVDSSSANEGGGTLTVTVP